MSGSFSRRTLCVTMNDNEFVAAQAPDGVEGANGPDDTFAHAAQDEIAGAMAVAIVDLFEAVQIEQHDHGDLRGLTMPMMDRALDREFDEVPVG